MRGVVLVMLGGCGSAPIASWMGSGGPIAAPAGPMAATCDIALVDEETGEDAAPHLSRVVIRYDDAGRESRYEYDDRSDGSVESTRDLSWDERGLLVAIEDDWGNRGRLDWWYYADYDDLGNIVLETSGSRSDEAGDRPTVFVHAYDADGHIVETHIDRGDDGVVDEWWRYTWNADGLLAFADRVDAGGQDERYGYDTDLHLLSVERVDDDGTVTHRTEYTWDGDLLITVVEDDLVDWYDVSLAMDETWTYHRDADGLLASLEYDAGSDGQVDAWEWYTWDTEGRLSTFEQDGDGDGRSEARSAWTYSSAPCAGFASAE